ncbi:MAG: sulfotransferase domain-containing protein [Verrucomicrobiota bacterium]|jgi:sulfotransferase
MVGFALHALREAIFGDQADRLLLLRYETLTADPLGALAKIYEFIGEPVYAHDRDHVQSLAEGIEFDKRLGTPGLHSVGSSVLQMQRRSILPTDLFKRYEAFSFWQRPDEMPAGIRVV